MNFWSCSGERNDPKAFQLSHRNSVVLCTSGEKYSETRWRLPTRQNQTRDLVLCCRHRHTPQRAGEVAHHWGVDFGPYLVDGGVASMGRGGVKAKVSSSLNHSLLQYYFELFFKGSEVMKTTLCDSSSHTRVQGKTAGIAKLFHLWYTSSAGAGDKNHSFWGNPWKAEQCRSACRWTDN